jgi:hypothetical protein
MTTKGENTKQLKQSDQQKDAHNKWHYIITEEEEG